jgi:hypothetical protein
MNPDTDYLFEGPEEQECSQCGQPCGFDFCSDWCEAVFEVNRLEEATLSELGAYEAAMREQRWPTS